jgi:hypothetical protein
MCPKCLFVRERGPVCPQCGHTAGEAIRRIRMGHGKLKEIPAIQKVQREKTEGEKLFAKWQSQLYGALHSGRTFGQAKLMFVQQTGQQPKDGWPGVFDSGSLDWKRRVNGTYNLQSLGLACRRNKPLGKFVVAHWAAESESDKRAKKSSV